MTKLLFIRRTTIMGEVSRAVIIFLVFCMNNVLSQEARQWVSDSKVVETDKGSVRGYKVKNGDYFAYLGIPYAAPPLGANRFKAPQPVKSWNETLDATRIVYCPQTGGGDEDCLVLNVFTPINTKDEKIPVLFYIPGGAYQYGRGPTRGMQHLIKNNIIVVTINYRLGAFGFLCLGTVDAPGNAALKDQVAALRWVHQNIGQFGGDKSQVTIHGDSAGSVSVELLILSKLANGLFRSAIVSSGSSLNPWAVDVDPVSTARGAAKLLNFTNIDSDQSLLDNFLAVPARDLGEANGRYMSMYLNGNVGFVPCLETEIEGEEFFMKELPIKVLSSKDYEPRPILIAFSTIEGLHLRKEIFYDEFIEQKIEVGFEELLPSDLVFDSDEIKKDVGKIVEEFYFGSETICMETIMGMLNFVGDTLILNGLLHAAKFHVDSGLYLMEFSYRGGMRENIIDVFPHIRVAGHGDTSNYVYLDVEAVDEVDKLMVERLATIISNFVKFRNPLPTPTDLLPVVWPPADLDSMSCLLIDKEMRVTKHPHNLRKQFWDQIYQKYGRDKDYY